MKQIKVKKRWLAWTFPYKVIVKVPGGYLVLLFRCEGGAELAKKRLLRGDVWGDIPKAWAG